MAVSESGCGEVVDPEDANRAVNVILELSSDRRRREDLGAAGRRNFERFFERKLTSTLIRSVLREVVR
jgi:glycosyltransferase involved in cell wall biosynthesis